MSKLNILYQFDNNYAPFAGVSLTTLLDNNQDIDDLVIYLAASKISEDNLLKFRQLSEQYHRSFCFLPTENLMEKMLEMGIQGWNGSLATWMKMFIMSAVPETVDQLLYIDSDTIVPGSLLYLAQLDLADWPVAAVIDSCSSDSQKRLRLVTPYFNAGVIYFNLKYWRTHQVEEKMLRHLKQHVAEYPVNDQDLLNDFFRGHILQLTAEYNFQGIHVFYRDKAYFSAMNWEPGAYYTEEEIAQARMHPCILHFFRFCGEYPWQPGNIHPAQKAYNDALQKSLWQGYQYPQKSLGFVFRVERLLYRVLPQKAFIKLLFRIK